MSDFIVQEDHQRAADNFKRIIKGEHIGPQEYRARRSDGSTFMGRFHSSLVSCDGKVIGIRGVVIDITDQKEAEDIIKSRLQYQQMVSKITLLALQSIDIDCFLNECARILGRSFGASGCHVFKYDHSVYQLSPIFEWSESGVPSLMDNLPVMEIQKGRCWSQLSGKAPLLIKGDRNDIFSHRVNRQLESLALTELLAMPLYVDGGLFGMVSVAMFVTQREFEIDEIEIVKTVASIISKRLENMRLSNLLYEQDQRLNKVFETIPHGIEEVDLEGKFKYCNPAFLKVTGYTHNEMISKSVYDLMINDNERKKLREYISVIFTKQPEPTAVLGTETSDQGSEVRGQRSEQR